MENHLKKLQMEIQRFGSPTFGLKLSGQDPIRPHTDTQLQAKSRRAKPLNFHLKFFGVVLHTILLGIRGCTKFFWSIDPLTVISAICNQKCRITKNVIETYTFSVKCLITLRTTRQPVTSTVTFSAGP